MELHTNYSLTNYIYNHSTECKQINDVKLHRHCYTVIIETIQRRKQMIDIE